MVRVLSVLIILVFVSVLVANKIHSVTGQVRSTSSTPITLVLGGDVMLGRSVTGISLDTKRDPIYPFLFVADVLRSADLTLVNLESPILEKCPRSSEGLIFCAPVKMISGLTFSGMDIVNLSNNHALNYGGGGLTQTKAHLAESRIGYVDNSRLVIKKIGDTSFGFLGFDKAQQSNPRLTQAEETLIRESDLLVDILIISMHWGIEYQAHPTTGQRNLASQLVKLGADAIVGHHPHWVQDIEQIGVVPVYYSLGNLVFDQAWSEPTKKGLIIRLTIQDGKIVNEESIQTYMNNFAQPQLVP